MNTKVISSRLDSTFPFLHFYGERIFQTTLLVISGIRLTEMRGGLILGTAYTRNHENQQAQHPCIKQQRAAHVEHSAERKILTPGRRVGRESTTTNGGEMGKGKIGVNK